MLEVEGEETHGIVVPRAFIFSLVILVITHTVHCKNNLPSITNPDKQITEYIVPDATHTLKCEADGSPQPRYQWTFNDRAISSDNMEVNGITGDLTIKTFSDLEAGYYQCFAANTDATAMSAFITIRTAKLGFTWPPSPQPNVTAKEGDYVNLTCDNPPDSVPDGQYSWQLNQGDESEGEIKTNERIYVDAKGTLHFIYVEKEDESNALRYKCGIRNGVLDIIKLGSIKSLTIERLSGVIQQTRPRIRFSTKGVKFLITTEAELECVFSGNPIPTITWFDTVNNEITSTSNQKYEITESGRKLTVKDLTERDEGMYRCKGTNAKGIEEEVIFLDVTSGPIWEEGLSSQTVSEDKDAVFTCKARSARGENTLGMRVSTPTWFKNGKPMTSLDVRKYVFSDNKRVMTVKKLTKPSDIACFQCKVSNEKGTEFGQGCLNVIEPIVVTSQPNLKQQISKGDQVDLTVIGKTDPAYNLTYRWYFGNKIYEGDESPPFVIFNQTTMQAYIKTSDLSDDDYKKIYGTYIRELYHPDDRLNVSIVVMPVPDPVVGAHIDLWWIGLIVALIILIIVIVLIVLVCKRKSQEGTYPLDKKERAHNIDPEKDLAHSSFHDLSRIPQEGDYRRRKSPYINPSFDYDDDESVTGSTGGDLNSIKLNEDASAIGYTSRNRTPEMTRSPLDLNHHSKVSEI